MVEIGRGRPSHRVVNMNRLLLLQEDETHSFASGYAWGCPSRHSFLYDDGLGIVVVVLSSTYIYLALPTIYKNPVKTFFNDLNSILKLRIRKGVTMSTRRLHLKFASPLHSPSHHLTLP